MLRFPPVMSRRQLEKSGYLKSFPNLLGCVCCLGGSETEIRAAVDRFEAGERVDAGALAGRSRAQPRRLLSGLSAGRGRGAVPAQGLLFDVACDCFRREPSKDLDRLQSFRMREYVLHRHAGADPRFPPALDDAGAEHGRSAGPALAHRTRQRSVLRPRRQAHGDEPGRAIAEVRAAVPVRSAQRADGMHELQLSSANISARPGTCAPPPAKSPHTGCVAFGMDRLALALFATHGLDLPRWPAAVRKALML